MKVTVIYGTMHKGSTYHIVGQLLEEMKTQTEVSFTSFSLPKDMPHFCNSCFNCFVKGEEKCPHFKVMAPIVKALDEADLIILASPVYALDVSGQMKAFLDHLAYRWMPHRPEKKMFQKIGLVVTTTAGAGIRPTIATMKRSLNYWGLKRVYSFGKVVGAMCYEEIVSMKKEKIEKQVKRLADKLCKVEAKKEKIKPTFMTRILFMLMRMSQKNNTWNPCDRKHWEAQGWLGDETPFEL